VTTTATTAPVSALQDEFAEFLGKLNQVSSQFATLRSDFRTLEKRWTRELRTAQKTVERRKRKVGNRAPSGFVKPTLISDELASFLGKSSGTEMARTEVTREINKYIRANALQDKENGRKINPDAALTSLLKLGSGDELTYFNLQRYMSPHFAKLGQDVPAANQQ
jgi:upstream activation factor subunit UAF30